MDAGFSEFLFGYALTEGLTERLRSQGFSPTSPPRFPSLREEGALGYDFGWDLPGSSLFLQFKLCKGMVRGSAIEAKEVADGGLGLRIPFLRMMLMPAKRSRQHRLLLELEKKGERVFYAAPRFYKNEDFSCHYRNHQIIRNSAFIAPGQIGVLPDDKEHRVAFEPSAKSGWLLSEPDAVGQILDGDELIESIMEDLRGEMPARDRVDIALERVRSVLAELGIQEEEATNEGDDAAFRRLAFLARRYFDALFVLIGRRREGVISKE